MGLAQLSGNQARIVAEVAKGDRLRRGRSSGYLTILTFGAVFSEVEQGKLDAVPISNPAITWPMGVAMRRDQSRKRTFIVIEELIRDVVADLLKQGIWR